MKMTMIQPREGEFHFEQADALVSFAERHGLQIVGHTLIWAKDEDASLGGSRDSNKPASRRARRMHAHIQAVASRYHGQDHLSGMWSTRSWMTASRISAPRVTANASAPSSSSEGVRVGGAKPKRLQRLQCRASREAKEVDAAIAELREKGTLDAIGIQGHWEVDHVPFGDIEAVLVSMQEQKLKVMVSELDLGAVPGAGGVGQEPQSDRDNQSPRRWLPAQLPRSPGQPVCRALPSVPRPLTSSIGRVTFWDLHDGRTLAQVLPLEAC